MTRRSTKRAVKKAGTAHCKDRDSNVRPLFEDGWSPMGPDDGAGLRDQSFLAKIKPRGENQAQLFGLIERCPVTFAMGPAGTGKTYVAVAKAVEALAAGRVGRIVLSRPAVEAGESLGFLPGDMEEKLSPYLRPLYDVLTDRMSAKEVRKMMSDGTIEVAPIGFMRGRTLNNAFVVIDEAQNCTYAQLKMLLTRLGWHASMVVTGDPAQSDLLPGVSGLAEIAAKLEGEEDIGVMRFAHGDVVRHPLVARMVKKI